MGRKPLPTEIKRLKGTLRPCRENKAEPKPFGVLGEPPDYLRPRAKEIWRNVLSFLPDGMITAADSAVLETYCTMCAMREDLQRKVDKEGAVSEYTGKLNPNFRALKDCQVAIAQAGSELGLTPASRSKVARGFGDPSKDDDFTLDLFASIDEEERAYAGNA